MKFIVIALALLGTCASAQADDFTFTYICNSKGKAFPLKIDGTHNEFIWHGRVLKTTELPAGEQDACPRFGWHVEGSEGESFNFCTATKGMVDFRYKGALVECEQNQ